MKKSILSLTALVTLGGFTAVAADSLAAGDLKNDRQKASYLLGLQAADQWRARGADLDWDAYVLGLREALAGKTNTISAADLKDAMQKFQAETRAKAEAKMKEEGDKNKEAGDKFLAANKSKEGIKTTESGLQYKVVKMGDGAKPAATDKVSVHYTGTLIDGKKFGSSVDRGQPAKFPLNGVIKGWTEGLQLMPVGSKFQFFIPPDLAYGLRAPSSIGPNQVLIFDVELLGIENAAPPAAAQPVTSDIIKVPSQEELAKGAKIEVIKPDEVQKLIEKEKAKQPEKK